MKFERVFCIMLKYTFKILFRQYFNVSLLLLNYNDIHQPPYCENNIYTLHISVTKLMEIHTHVS